MKLQGRDLHYRMDKRDGDDVALLQKELNILIGAGKLNVQIDPVEISRKFFGPSTRNAVIAFQSQQRIIPDNGVVDERTARAINVAVDALQPKPFSVSGYVVNADGSPVAGCYVKAFDQGIYENAELGSGVTDGEGFYNIAYSADQLSYEGKTQADLIVSVFRSRRLENVLVSSPLILNALEKETVNLAIGEES